MTARLIYSGKHVIISHCRDCEIPGYMIVSLKRCVSNLEELNSTESSELIRSLALAERALNAIFSPKKIYIMRISELNPEVHFHIFPRYTSATELYMTEHHETIIDGPFFFSWARRKFNRSEPGSTPEMLHAQSILAKTLKSYFSQPQ